MATNTIEKMVEPAAAAHDGLTSAEAQQRLRQYGLNMAAEERRHPLLELFRKFWAPVPWMLEVTLILELAMARYTEAGVIAVLLVFNAVLSFVQEHRAQNALSLLRQRLAVQTRVRRDGRWQLLPAQYLVPGDVIYLRMGDVVPADTRIDSGQVLLDQSALTGESLPVEAAPGQPAYAGTIVKRGEARGEITATGTHTVFGKTAELVRLARTGSHLEQIVFKIVRYLVALDVLLVIAVLVYALVTGIALFDILPFALILLVASIPVALPATFTVATALGALELTKQGVLVTRLSAIEEAAGMEVLCSDKTGTITKNELVVSDVYGQPPKAEDDVARLAAMACDESTQDPIDLAILAEARRRKVAPDAAERIRFVPFDPAVKRSEGYWRQGTATLRVVKGAPATICSLTSQAYELVAPDVERLAALGARVLAVAAGPENELRVAGLIALSDPPREDSARLIQDLKGLGVRVLMVTGDTLPTARALAHQVGLGDRGCGRDAMATDLDALAGSCDIFAGVLPEDKYHLVKALQQGGQTVGMTGDGVNDAPALKQAEVGIAVASATDVAKAAASLVLTNPGLENVVAAVKTSRRIYRRMLTYTLNKIVKTFEIAILLSVGLMLTGVFVTTPTLIVLLLFTNDFVTMSIATDRVTSARTPERWHIRPLVLTGLVLAMFVLVLSFGVFFWARDVLQLPLGQLQTLIFVMLVFSGQATVYLVRERRHFWNSWPSRSLLISSLVDLLVVSFLATQGILMQPISPTLVIAVLGLVLGYMIMVDFLKIKTTRYARLD